jgi:hypothetical protein
MTKDGKDTSHLTQALEPVELVPGTEYLLVIFNSLSMARGAGMSQPLPISYVDIKAYCDLTDLRLAHWELETLRVMDHAYIATTAEN